jgi:hypothetical protein
VTARAFRPRLLLLPIAFGALLAPMLFKPILFKKTTTPAAEHGAHSGAVCSNVVEPKHKLLRNSQPSCANCRAPLLDAPLAQAAPRAPVPAMATPAA